MSFSCLDVARAAGLEERRRVGDETLFVCPRHDDHEPSLNVNAKKDVWLCAPCDVKGTPWALAAFVACVDPGDKRHVKDWLRERGLLDGTAGQEVARYEYRSPSGKLLYTKIRTLQNGQKLFFRSPKGKKSSLYGLERLAAAKGKSLFLSESEKDADALAKLGFVAVSSGGASVWKEQWADAIANAAPRGVAICEHADSDGERFARERAAPSLGRWRSGGVGPSRAPRP